MSSISPGGGARPEGSGKATTSDAYSRKWLSMAVVAIGTFMATLDASIVNISLPTITQALNTNLATVQWVVVAYLLTITSLLLSFGRLSDILGRKVIYITGFSIFTVASGLCGITQSIEQLILLRAIQGVGAAMTMAMSAAVITTAFPPGERGKALGINGTVVAVGTSLGPSLGGILLRLMDWRMVFFARVPVGILGVTLALLVLKEAARPSEKHRFDLLGAGLLSLSLSSLLLALNRGQEVGWGSTPSNALFAIAAFLLIAFVNVEMRVAQPMLDLSLFRRRLFAAANASSMLNYFSSSGTIFLMPFFLGGVLLLPPDQIGLLMTATPLAIMMVAPASGWLSDRVGSRWLSPLGISTTGVAMLLLSRLGEGTTPAQVIPGLALMGVGHGLFQSPNNNALMGSVPRERVGIAAGMLATMRNLGNSLGVALVGAVYSTRHAHYVSAAGSLDPNAALSAATMVPAFHDAFLTAAFIAALGLCTSLVRGQDRPKRTPAPAQPGNRDPLFGEILVQERGQGALPPPSP